MIHAIFRKTIEYGGASMSFSKRVLLELRCQIDPTILCLPHLTLDFNGNSVSIGKIQYLVGRGCARITAETESAATEEKLADRVAQHTERGWAVLEPYKHESWT